MSINPRPKNRLNLLDRRILDCLQEDIVFVPRPWKIIAGKLKIKEDLLLKRIAVLKKQGIIRRISAIFSPGKINFVSTLVAAKIAPECIAKAAKRINLYPEVTHNYKRNADYNLWFTLIAPNAKRIGQIIAQIKKNKDIQKVAEFPATKIFKINVKFSLQN